MPTAPRHLSKAALKAAALGLAVSFASATAALSDITLKFGAYTADKPTEVVKQFKPFLDYIATAMSDKLDEPVSFKIVIAKSYEQGNLNLTSGAVDISRFGPASYVTAKDIEPDIGIVAMETKNGEKTFKGVIAVHAENPIGSVDELAGKSFAFGDPLSTIGRYLAQDQLLQSGIEAGDLSGFDYLLRHDRVGAAVGQGSFDAGALKSSTFKNLVDKGVPIRALADFDNVTKPWLHRADLDPRIVDAMQAVFLEISDPDVLKSMSKSGFVLGSDEDYQVIRDAMSRSTYFGG